VYTGRCFDDNKIPFFARVNSLKVADLSSSMTLQISNISKRYGNNWVLRDISLSVEKGQIIGLLGFSGSGKSTLLRILAGTERPSPPNAKLNERHVTLLSTTNDQPRSRFFGWNRNASTDPMRRVEDALASADDILLLDDPLALVDDVRLTYAIQMIRRAVAEKGMTAIYATSRFQTAAQVADSIAVINSSVIEQVGTPEEIYDAPISSAVARITGPCNIFTARRLTSTKFEIPEFQTIDGGHRLFAEKADVAKLGAINRNVSLAIRPESISMSFEASFPEDNLLRARVESIKFLGSTTAVRLDAGGLALETAVFRLVGLNVGDECVLGLPPDRIKVLRD
jgi:ABC-type Fe3+/spermidine/putrescine transport system ATPase subunit